MNRSFLSSQGLDNEQVEAIMREHGKTTNALRDDLDQLKGQLEVAESEKTALENEKSVLEESNQQLKEVSANAEQLKTELTEIKTGNTIQEVLTAAGVNDVDYAKFKLGALELDEDGKIIDIDSKLSELKESKPSLFNQPSGQDNPGNDNKNNGINGYRPIPADLKGKNGEPAEPSILDKIQERLGGK